MSQQSLQLMEGNALFQLVGGIGMAQGMNATAFLNATGALGLMVHLLERGDMKVLVWQQITGK
jgi:hypothetical protein